MTNDHLDKDTTLSAEITEKGIKAGARSRFVAAADRLAGGILDVANAHIEAHVDKRRAKTKGEVELIEAVAKYGIKYLRADPAHAERAVRRHFDKVLAQQNNSDAVLREALEDLSSNPPDAASSSNNEKLDEQFLESLEDYSATASTDELRQRWGRVLAAEVRSPGTFSRKVLRVVDELDAKTARIFEETASQGFGRVLPKSTVGEMPFATKSALVLADLLVEPGISGQVRLFREVQDETGTKMWEVGDHAAGCVAFPHTVDFSALDADDGAMVNHDGTPAVPCYLLTDAGAAIATILPDTRPKALRYYAETLLEVLSTPWIRIYLPDENGNLEAVEEIDAG